MEGPAGPGRVVARGGLPVAVPAGVPGGRRFRFPKAVPGRPGISPGGFFQPAPSTLHVYLEGDGRPWQTRWHIAEDPTPREPVMLRLMARDHQAALYPISGPPVRLRPPHRPRRHAGTVDPAPVALEVEAIAAGLSQVLRIASPGWCGSVTAAAPWPPCPKGPSSCAWVDARGQSC
ncbi:protein of unknown function [Candidatus Methylocalor cossyra]|uniref:Uncharacterized protein n=1 Tax=Candidatus Methylocalor cossyra TaxID=3108543 RepID=A0ABP1CB63_9GAMM